MPRSTETGTPGIPLPGTAGDDRSGPDGGDAAAAARGFIAPVPDHVADEHGSTVWDMRGYAFLGGDGDAPDTVHPGLWRQSRLAAEGGLFEVADGVYQVRGLDLSNMTLIEGEAGVVVVDPLVSAETAGAALDLYRAHRGERPVTAVVYTHSHVDHFGGVLGVADPADAHAGVLPIAAPEHFMAFAAAENVDAGTAMLRRGAYFSAAPVAPGPEGSVGMGLGPATSHGAVGLIPPNLDITRTGQTEVLDGVRFEFQLTPGTEAPAEMNFLLPDRRALCMAENACHTLHNLLTLRGAQVRDARAWSRYLNQSIELFGDRADVAFASHHWPTWGGEEIRRFLGEQRDTYAYLHDQTVRRMNSGETGTEIAEDLRLPPSLEAVWSVRGYYGSVSHNVKAVYQRYMGWFDGNPATLWQHPPAERAQRYARAFGGTAALIERAEEFADEGDLRFAAELASHAVFAEPGDARARTVLAGVLTRLGHGAECATWRNFYLTGAQELRGGIAPTPIRISDGLAAALSAEQILDAAAVRLDGPRAARESAVIDIVLNDDGTRHRALLSNGALIHCADPRGSGADVTVFATRMQLARILLGGSDEPVDHEGDAGALARLTALLDPPDPDFPIVTP